MFSSAAFMHVSLQKWQLVIYVKWDWCDIGYQVRLWARPLVATQGTECAAGKLCSPNQHTPVRPEWQRCILWDSFLLPPTEAWLFWYTVVNDSHVRHDILLYICNQVTAHMYHRDDKLTSSSIINISDKRQNIRKPVIHLHISPPKKHKKYLF